ncbi:hypothetical protein DF183_16660 [Alcaligenes faecalis]|uniref:Restriction alleviation protein, Lar family n=2 Tax=Alcaligenes faecalis TaxID=511 RepID=A0A2U2BHE2_ALCFA|nr:hypothetical protein DF183_16660 [Alcaligenes faecalis]
MSTETRLKPCPFCGGAAKEFERFNANVITCRRCGVKVRQSEMGEGDAAERWNQRATPVAAQPDVTQQTLDDVMAGIPARDAEIAALRKEIEALQAVQVQPYSLDLDPAGIRALTADAISGALALGFQGVNPPPNNEHWLAPFWEIGRESAAQVQQPVSGADGLSDYPTHGMNLGQRIAHVGGRENAQGYVEFGSPMAVHALIQHVLRDFHRQGRVNLTPAQQDADKVDADRYRAWRDAAVANSTPFVRAMRDTLPPEAREGKPRWPTAAEWDAAIDAARKENSNA